MDEPFVLMPFLKAICTFQNQVFKHFCWISLITLKTRPFQGLLLILVCRQNFSSPDDWEGSQDMALLSQGSSCVWKRLYSPHWLYWSSVLFGTHPAWAMSAAGRFMVCSGRMSWQGSDSTCCSGCLENPVVLSCTLLGCINGPFFSSRASFTQLILARADETYSNGSMSIHAQISVWSWNLSLEHLLLSLFQRWEFNVVDCNVSEGLWIVDQEVTFSNERSFHFLFSLPVIGYLSAVMEGLCVLQLMWNICGNKALWQSGMIFYCNLLTCNIF